MENYEEVDDSYEQLPDESEETTTDELAEEDDLTDETVEEDDDLDADVADDEERADEDEEL